MINRRNKKIKMVIIKIQKLNAYIRVQNYILVVRIKIVPRLGRVVNRFGYLKKIKR